MSSRNTITDTSSDNTIKKIKATCSDMIEAIRLHNKDNSKSQITIRSNMTRQELCNIVKDNCLIRKAVEINKNRTSDISSRSNSRIVKTVPVSTKKTKTTTNLSSKTNTNIKNVEDNQTESKLKKINATCDDMIEAIRIYNKDKSKQNITIKSNMKRQELCKIVKDNGLIRKSIEIRKKRISK